MVDRNMFGVCLFNFKSAILILLFSCWHINGSIDGEYSSDKNTNKTKKMEIHTKQINNPNENKS